MAISKCGKCNSMAFEIAEHTPHGSSFKLMFVQCASCGTVVGVTDYYNIGAQTEDIRATLKKIASKVGVHLGY